MKATLAPKILLAVAIAALIAVVAPVLKAGDYHTGGTLYCQECHVMHYSQSHAYASETPVPLAGGPNQYLLRQAGSNACLACHSNTSTIPDVSGADANTTGSGGRQGGSITTGSSPYVDANGHTMSTSSVTPPGTTTAMTNGLRCYDCHAAHGSDYYRNVNTAVSWENSPTPANTKDVRVGVALAAVGSRITAGTYSRDNIFFNEPDTAESKYGDFCATCHGDFHGTGNTGTGSAFTRHPTEDVDFSSDVQTQFATATTHAQRVQVMIDSNAATGITDWSSATPSCMSCHKAHGSTNPFGLIYADGTAVGEDGAGDDVNDLCRRCHNK